MHARKPRQLGLVFRTWGGARKGAGRKPAGLRPGVAHRQRPVITSPHPIHVTLRVRRDVGTLRTAATHEALKGAFARGHTAEGMRMVHYSVQHDHVHMIVEAADTAAMSRRMQGLLVRMARAINRARGRHGPVFADRFHAVVLRSPRQVRNALAYVLSNHRRHAAKAGRALPPGVDAFSSWAWFDGWREGPGAGVPVDGPRLVGHARCWLLTTGWRRHGLPSIGEIPGGASPGTRDRAPPTC